MIEHEAIKEKNEEILKMVLPEDVLVPVKFKQHHAPFMKLLIVFDSMWDGHLVRSNLSEHLNNISNDDIGRI